MLQMLETDLLAKRDLFVVEDDFQYYVTGDKWVGGGDTDAPEMVADVPSGVVRVLTTAVDNEESWLHTAQEAFLFNHLTTYIHDKKPLVFEFLGYYTEVTGDTLNVFIGFMNDIDTTPFQDSGAGIKADFCGFGFMRLGDGVTAVANDDVWHTVVDNLTDFVPLTQPLTAANQNNLTGVKQNADIDTLVRLSGMCRPIRLVSATVLELEFAFWVNDIQVVYERCNMTIANFVVMHGGIAMHNGDAQIASVYADYLSFSQQRIPII